MADFSGADLRAKRQAAGLSQRALAKRAGVHYSAVQYWEKRPVLVLRSYAIQRIAKALGWRIIGQAYARARHGVLASDWDTLGPSFWLPYQTVLAPRLFTKLVQPRVPCGARTRKGTPCKALSEPGRTRCRFHGGLSTGPKTEEGRKRIAEAQRRRWARR